MTTNRLIWKIRFVKPYPEAHTHLLIGQVVGRDDACLELMCRSFHHGRAVNGTKGIVVGEMGKRIVPWIRIEIINELPASFDFQNAKLKTDQKNGIFFSDNHYHCPIVTMLEKQY
ncbi:MAG: hypothetical protein K8S55_08685 [Phycisphaerae bacterium]|nr:hypothetical protein [Phycisphaerae bacterium]